MEELKTVQLTKRQINIIGFALDNKLKFYVKNGNLEKANELLEISTTLTKALYEIQP